MNNFDSRLAQGMGDFERNSVSGGVDLARSMREREFQKV